MKVIALDPGRTTGYAVGLIQPHEPMGVISGQAEWDERQIYEQLSMGKPDIVVYEKFESGRQNAYRAIKHKNYDVDLFPRNLIGVINLYCSQNNIKAYEQSPAKGLGGHFRLDSVLQQAGVYKIANPHANDAMRHLLQWYTFGSGFQYDTDKKGFVPLA